ENGDLEVTIRAGEAPPYFHRRFEARTTKEVRLYLYGGNDKVVVTGGRHGGVLFRVVAGEGEDVLDDSQGRHPLLRAGAAGARGRGSGHPLGQTALCAAAQRGVGQGRM